MKDLTVEEIKELDGQEITAEKLEELRKSSLVDRIELVGAVSNLIPNKDYKLIKRDGLFFSAKVNSSLCSSIIVKVEVVQVN